MVVEFLLYRTLRYISTSMFCVQFSLKLISIYFLMIFNKFDCISKEVLCVLTVYIHLLNNPSVSNESTQLCSQSSISYPSSSDDPNISRGCSLSCCSFVSNSVSSVSACSFEFNSNDCSNPSTLTCFSAN